MVSSKTRQNGSESVGATVNALDPSIELKWRERFANKSKIRYAPMELDLPSGLAVEAVRMPLRFLLRKGLIPDPVSPIIHDYIARLDDPDPDARVEESVTEFNETPLAAFKRWQTILDTVWQCCVRRPLFTDDSDREDAEEPPYYTGDVDYFDKLYVYQWAQGVDESVIDFLRGQDETMGALANGDSIPLSSEPVLRVERRGGRLVGLLGGQSDVPVGDVHQEQTGSNQRSSRTKDNQKAHDSGAQVQPGSDQSDDLRPITRPRKKRAT